MSLKRKLKEYKRFLKIKKRKNNEKIHPYGVCYCEKEKLNIGYVSVHLKRDRVGKTYCKEKAKAIFWKEDARWIPGYKPTEEQKQQMIDGKEAFCPKCGGKASFIILYNVKYKSKPIVTKEQIEQHKKDNALNRYDNSFNNKENFAQYIDKFVVSKLKNKVGVIKTETLNENDFSSQEIELVVKKWFIDNIIYDAKYSEYIFDKYISRAAQIIITSIEVWNRI